MQNRFGKFDTTSFQEIILSSGVFRRETASGFYPWGNVVSPRKRVAEGLCGWRHGNSFPMTQSAQSHRQMRSIPRCSKAVFYVFVFDYIHDSATMHNLSQQTKRTVPLVCYWTLERRMVEGKKATPGAAWGLRSALVFWLWKPHHYSGGRLFQHRELFYLTTCSLVNFTVPLL